MPRKIIPYILILTVLAGIFGIAQNVRAADPTGTCKVTLKKPGGASGIDIKIKEEPGMTHSACLAKYPDGSYPPGEDGYMVTIGGVLWISDGPPIDTTPGICVVRYTSGAEPRNLGMIESECLEKYKKGIGNVFSVYFDKCASPKIIQGDKCVFPPDPGDGGGEKERDTKYHLLSPLPGVGDSEDNFETNLGGAGLTPFLNAMIKIFIGICAVLAVIMIILGGLEYMTSELVSSKEHGRERITHAIFGLLLALGAWTILNQINPELLNADLKNLKTQEVTVELEPEIGVVGDTIVTAGGKQLKACDESQLIPISLLGSNVRVHKGVASSLIRTNTKWLAMSPQYKVNSVGGYNCRKVAGTNSWSAHAFGVALDINPNTNPFGKDKKTDMPDTFVQLFTSEGWGWGGNWSSVKDPMHFSKYPPAEGGNGAIEI